MLKAKFLFFSIWLFVSAIFSSIIWCVFHSMPNEGWLFWIAIMGIVLLCVLYLLLVLCELLCYFVYIYWDKIVGHTVSSLRSFWSIIIQVMSNPFVFMRQMK